MTCNKSLLVVNPIHGSHNSTGSSVNPMHQIIIHESSSIYICICIYAYMHLHLEYCKGWFFEPLPFFIILLIVDITLLWRIHQTSAALVKKIKITLSLIFPAQFCLHSQ